MRLTFTFQLTPPTGAIVGNNLFEHCAECTPVDRFTLIDGHRAGGLVIVPAGDDPFWIGNDGAVVEEYIDMILSRRKGTDIALEHKVRVVRTLDGFANFGISSVN